ncbi:MAG: hypothetical protein II680_10045 [Clostridia bacterium]|nr:hypothetical protein [Clostridia bacterium]
MNSGSYPYYPAAPAKKKSKAPIIILVAVLVLAAVAGTLFLFLHSDPAAKLTKAVKTSLKAAKSSEPVSVLSSAAEAGSIEISGSAADLTESLLGIRVDAGVRLKAVMNTKKATEGSLEGAISINGAEMADFAAYTDGKSLAVQSEAILGQSAYGVGFGEIRGRFDQSVFGPDGEYSLGIDGAALGDFFEGIAEGAENKDKAKLGEKTLLDLFALVKKYAEFEESAGEIPTEFCGRIPVKNIALDLGGEKLYGFLKDLLAYARDSEEFAELYKDLAPAYEKLAGDLPDPENYGDWIDEMLSDLESRREEIEKTTLSFVFHISKKNGQIVGIDFTGVSGVDGSRLEADLLCAPDWKSPSEIRADMKVGEESGSFTWFVRDDGELKTYALEAKISGEPKFNGIIRRSTVSGDLLGNFQLKDGMEVYGEYSFSGNLEIKDGKTVLRLDSVDFGDTSLALGGIKITVRESDELKPIPEYRDALSLTADEVGKIAEDAEEFAGKMATEAFGIFGGLILGGLLG